jgi:DNA-binding Xre family transcriptional regulator
MAQETIAERLQTYFINKHIKVAQVSRETGIQYDSLQQILSGKVKAMGVDKFAAIWKVFPDLDAWYILTGEATEHQRQVTTMTTVEQLKQFKADIDQALDKRIQELGG